MFVKSFFYDLKTRNVTFCKVTATVTPPPQLPVQRCPSPTPTESMDSRYGLSRGKEAPMVGVEFTNRTKTIPAWRTQPNDYNNDNHSPGLKREYQLLCICLMYADFLSQVHILRDSQCCKSTIVSLQCTGAISALSSGVRGKRPFPLPSSSATRRAVMVDTSTAHRLS